MYFWDHQTTEQEKSILEFAETLQPFWPSNLLSKVGKYAQSWRVIKPSDL